MFDLPGANLRDIVELASRWRVAPDALLAGLPITMEALAQPTTRVPVPVCEAIVARALALTGEPALAFHLGANMKISSHGFLGFAAMTASTAGEALALATRFASTRTSALALALYVERDTASLVIEERASLGVLREFAVIALMVGLWRIGHALTGVVPDGVGECAFVEPAYVARLPLGGRLRFDRPAHRLVFPAALLASPIVSADLVATQLAREQCERELAAIAEASLPARIRAVVAEKPGAGVVAIARALHVSPRTLKRKLADHGTTFSAIRDAVRLQRALLLLDDRALSIAEIALRLGYTEVANFSRAFRKWTGRTPASVRDMPR